MNIFLTPFKSPLKNILVLILRLYLASSVASAGDPTEETLQSMEKSTCETYVINSEIENRYDSIRENLEKNFNSGLPHQLKGKLVDLRSETDELTQKMFDTSSLSEQEVSSLLQETLNRLEKFIQLLPEIVDNAPKVRDQYVVPFTNISSLKAEHQDCLMSVAIEQAQTEAKEQRQEASSSLNIYKKITDELNHLNDNLYLAETSDVQKFIQIRAQLLELMESYNKEHQVTEKQKIVSNIPMAINAVQSEIEKLLPGLQLSENYYSLKDQ